MPCSPKQQQHKRRRVGLVAIAAAASYQLLLPQTAADRDRGLAFAGSNQERQMVLLLVLLLTASLFIAAVVIRRSGRNKRVCEKLVTKWRELSKNGAVDRKEFENGVKKIFTGANEIGETETSYLYGLISRLDTEEEQIDELALQSGLKKIMSLIGQKQVETVDDMREVLQKLSTAAQDETENADAIEAEVKKEMSSKSMVDMDDAADDIVNPPLDSAALEWEASHPQQDQEPKPANTREWRCTWSDEANMESLDKCQEVLDECLSTLNALPGCVSVQRAVCAGTKDFKIITQLKGEHFDKWRDDKNFAPEAEVLAKLKAIPNVSNVESQTLTLMPM